MPSDFTTESGSEMREVLDALIDAATELQEAHEKFDRKLEQVLETARDLRGPEPAQGLLGLLSDVLREFRA